MDLKYDQASTKNIKMKEILVRGGQLSYKSTKHVVSVILIAIVFFSLFFRSLSSLRVSCIIQLLLGHLNPTLVDHLSPYLSTCPIRHPLQLSVSCSSQDSTVQGSPQYKYGQKSSYIVFNAMVATFPQIFLCSYYPYTFMIHVIVTGVSWKVTMIARVHV